MFSLPKLQCTCKIHVKPRNGVSDKTINVQEYNVPGHQGLLQNSLQHHLPIQ